MGTEDTQTARLISLLQREGLIRARELARWHIDRKTLARACRRGLVERSARGTYCLPQASPDPHRRLALACKRVPHGTVCLLSALWYHGLLAQEPTWIWIGVERKARWPRVPDLDLKLVRYSGEAFTTGSVNVNVQGTPLRVFSPMKSVADCFKYRDLVGPQIAIGALTAALKQNQYNRQKLLRFAGICRIMKLVSEAADAAERAAKQDHLAGRSAALQIDNPEALRQLVWAEPLRQMARRYGISDVALAKRCKKLNIVLPGRGYWAKKAK